MILYAAKIEDEYLKLEPDGVKRVSMQKASVYPSIGALREAFSDDLGISEYHVVELTITERKLE